MNEVNQVMKKNTIIYMWLVLIWINATAGEYHVDKSQANLVKFISDAPMEDFEGVTDKIDGYLFWNEEDTLATGEIYMEVDLNSVDTGIGLRNRHMRENYLETDRFPITYFKGKIIRMSNEPDGSTRLVADGVMFIHGIEKEKSVEAFLHPEGDGFKIMANFSIALPDYQIEVPQLMFLKINENIALELEFYVKEITGEQD